MYFLFLKIFLGNVIRHFKIEKVKKDVIEVLVHY